MKTMEENEQMQGFVRMCTDGWLQGWHERNGGNLTYRIPQPDVDRMRPFFCKTPREWVPMGVRAENLAGEYFISTGSGKFMRNVALAPKENIGIVEINETGDSYRIVWGLENGGKPTSEFPSHFLNHGVKKRVSDGRYRVIYHAHTTNLIALTFLLPLDAKTFSRVLWKSATECPVVFPDGVGVVPWMVPGGSDIARETSRLMESYDAAIWAHHGLFCAGEDFDTTFGLMHTIEKSAEIYLKVLSSGQPLRQTITDEDLLAIAKEFGVSLKEEFLD